MGAADEEPRRAVAGSLPALSVDRRFLEAFAALLGKDAPNKVAGRDLAADGRMADRSCLKPLIFNGCIRRLCQ